VVPDGHVHAPAWQTWPDGHALPQRPQLALSLASCAQVAVRPLPQTARPAAQLSLQAPAEHTCPSGQLAPHWPQFSRSLVRSVQTIPPDAVAHKLWLARQVGSQAPRTQDSPDGQSVPQPPQLVVSVDVSTQALPHRARPTVH
jgi:hypothetical protein